MSIAIRILGFLAKHLIAVCGAIVLGCIAWTMLYVGLLIYAMIANEDVGGPLAYPAGLLVIVIAGAVIGWGIFTPATAVGAIVCHWLKLPKLAAIPIVFVSGLAIFYMPFVISLPSMTDSFKPTMGSVLTSYLVFLSVPLGIYWWVTEGPGALWDAFRRWRAGRADNSPPCQRTGTT